MREKTALRFEPMTLGMILDTTFRLYSQNVSLILGITALGYVPYFVAGLLVVLLGVFYRQTPEAFNASVFAILAALIPLALLVLVAYPLSTGAATYAIGQRYLHKPISAVDAMKVTWKRYGTLCWAISMAGVIIMGGFLLLIVPGILWALSYALLVPVVALESGNAKESRRRSWALVAGNRGKVFAVLFIIGLLAFLVSGAIQAILTFFLESHSLPGQLTTQLVKEIASFLLAPLPIIASVLLYYDMRIRKEGFDLEMLSQALSQP